MPAMKLIRNVEEGLVSIFIMFFIVNRSSIFIVRPQP